MKICVFCASSPQVGEPYRSAMTSLGECIAARGHSLVFGGYDSGLMGIVAHAVGDNGGKVYGVIPQNVGLFETRSVYDGFEVFEVADLSARKDKMCSLADAYIAGPGGFGTYDELYEVLVEEKLTSRRRKPIGLFDVEGCYQLFEQLTNQMVSQNLCPESDKFLYAKSPNPEELVQELERRL